MKVPGEKKVRTIQKGEIAQYLTYKMLSKSENDRQTRDILARMSAIELKHYEVLRKYTGREEKPNKIKIWFYYALAKILGLTFGLKLMERDSVSARAVYKSLSDVFPAAREISRDEVSNEINLIKKIHEDRLIYTGSIVRGLNDALVELTGALAGYTLALQQARLIAGVGLITGIAATLSMGVTEYLARKSEEVQQTPVKSAVYTVISYFITVIFLILPFLLINNVYICLAATFIIALIMTLAFNFYVSVAKDLSFRRRFLEMAVLSFGVAAISFGIGFLVKKALGLEL